MWVLSTLSYSSETWLTYSVKGLRLNCVYQRHLRTIMNVTLKDHVSNHDILAKGKIPSLPALISQKRLWHWVMSLEWKTVGSLWKLCLGSRPHWQTSTSVQGCLQTWLESLRHRDSHHPGETAEHNRTTWTKVTSMGWKQNDEKHQINGRSETNHHINFHQMLPSNTITTVKSVVKRLDFTAIGYAVHKNNSVTFVKHVKRVAHKFLFLCMKACNWIDRVQAQWWAIYLNVSYERHFRQRICSAHKSETQYIHHEHSECMVYQKHPRSKSCGFNISLPASLWSHRTNLFH